MTLSRRDFLLRSGVIGCSAAASPLITPVTFASTPNDARLVVIILRGAMDGLDVVRPIGDTYLRTHRPQMDMADSLDLNGFFALHPQLAKLHPLYAKGELGFAQALSTPYRDQRSHFAGQDLLEAGIAGADYVDGSGSGWLNRMLGLIQGSHAKTAFAVGNENMLILNGKETTSAWAPGRTLPFSQAGQHLLNALYSNDPLFSGAFDLAQNLSAEELTSLMAQMDMDGDDFGQMDMSEQMQMNAQAGRRQGRAKQLAQYTADRLNEDARIAAFSIGGWDTHVNQENTILPPLRELETAILELRTGLKSNWSNTIVLAMTEFGRTVHANGSGGTDHGTAGALVMAGGALKGGRVYGDWPGLSEPDLYDRRDLLPTADVRSYAASVMRDFFGLAETDLERVVFPGLRIEAKPQIVL